MGEWRKPPAPLTHPSRGVALPLGGQNPISLEYQIYPPAIDTLVTGMGGGGGGSAIWEKFPKNTVF